MSQKYGVNPTPHNQQFYWSADNQLDSLTYDGYYRVRYRYNALGKPVEKYRQGSLDRVWLWDGESLLAEFDASNHRVADYMYNGIDHPYAAVTGATTATGIQYHEQDELGNVLGTHTGTSVTESISYDPWGVPSYTGTLNSRLMWKGLLWEGGPAQGDVVGLSYVRGRWYDPQPGRFIQEDPLGVDGGVNVYLYAGDDPINGFDPSGMRDSVETLSTLSITAIGGNSGNWLSVYEAMKRLFGTGQPVQIGGGGSPPNPPPPESETERRQGWTVTEGLSCTLGYTESGTYFSRSGVEAETSQTVPLSGLPSAGCGAGTYLVFRGDVPSPFALNFGGKTHGVSAHFDGTFPFIQAVGYHVGMSTESDAGFSISTPIDVKIGPPANIACAKSGVGCAGH